MKNNQKSASKANYTGAILAENCYYACAGKTFYGNSTDAGSLLAPKGATALAWPGLKLNFTYDQINAQELLQVLPAKTGAGVQKLSSAQWMATSN